MNLVIGALRTVCNYLSRNDNGNKFRQGPLNVHLRTLRAPVYLRRILNQKYRHWSTY